MRYKILLAIMLSLLGGEVYGQIVEPPGQVVQPPTGEPYHPDPQYNNGYYNGCRGHNRYWNDPSYGNYGHGRHHSDYYDRNGYPP